MGHPTLRTAIWGQPRRKISEQPDGGDDHADGGDDQTAQTDRQSRLQLSQIRPEHGRRDQFWRPMIDDRSGDRRGMIGWQAGTGKIVGDGSNAHRLEIAGGIG